VVGVTGISAVGVTGAVAVWAPARLGKTADIEAAPYSTDRKRLTGSSPVII